MMYAPYWLYTPWTLSFMVRSAQPGQRADAGDAAGDLEHRSAGGDSGA